MRGPYDRDDSPQFLLAKYVQDSSRNEPRNIGMVFWNNGKVLTRFLERTQVKSFVNELDNYDRWLEWWHTLIQRGAVDRRPEKIDSPNFLNALMSVNTDQYYLESSLELGHDVTDEQAEHHLKKYFNQLVL